MPFKIIFSILPFVLISCSQLSKEDCQRSRVQAVAFQDGTEGTSNRYSRLKKRCKKKPKLELAYQESYTKGLLKFCSYSRGQEQAGLGVEKETSCLISPSYVEGFLAKLRDVCNKEKARIDARKLLNSDNRLCLQIPTYERSYLYHLAKQCSYKKGYSIGLQKKGLVQNCKDSKNLANFKKGYEDGLSEGYQRENLDFQKTISNLQSERKSIQSKLAKNKTPEEIQKNKIELNVLESKILELEHQVEKNKRFID